MRGHPYKGLWLNFEAGEGGGKGTQLKMLSNYLQHQGYDYTQGREPGSTQLGEHIRIALQNPDMPELDKKTELLLYVAAGIEFFGKDVKPILERGGIFSSDRWRYSTKAYQGYGLNLDLDFIDKLIDFSCDGAKPDITFLIDVNPETGLSKISGHEFEGHEKDKIEARPLTYHEKVRNGYLEIAKQNPESFRIIPYMPGNPHKMQKIIRTETNKFIKQNGLEDILIKK